MGDDSAPTYKVFVGGLTWDLTNEELQSGKAPRQHKQCVGNPVSLLSCVLSSSAWFVVFDPIHALNSDLVTACISCFPISSYS
jgi:hypothetical protein